MKRDFEAAGEELGKCTLQHIENAFGVMQTETSLAVSLAPDSNQTPLQNLSVEVPDDALEKCKLECSPQTNTGEGQVSNELIENLESNPSSSHESDMQNGVSKDLELDKNLPPIKTRREGDPREHSPSDSTPPSPKRLRQGSRETQEKWNGLWNTEGNL